MTNNEHAQERCPSCYGNEIEADRRYGNKLKGREFLRQFFRSPVIWIGFALLVLPAWMPILKATGQIAWRYVLEALGIVLIVIRGERMRRAFYGSAAPTHFPEARYTCRHCGHQWTSTEPQAAVAQETGDKETADRIEPQQAKTDFRIEENGKSQTSNRSVAISLLFAIFLNVLVILFIDWVANGRLDGDYLVMCLPVSAVILALCAGAGKLLAKSLGGNTSIGVTIGIWIGAIVSIAVLLGGFLLIGSGG